MSKADAFFFTSSLFCWRLCNELSGFYSSISLHFFYIYTVYINYFEWLISGHVARNIVGYGSHHVQENRAEDGLQEAQDVRNPIGDGADAARTHGKLYYKENSNKSCVERETRVFPTRTHIRTYIDLFTHSIYPYNSYIYVYSFGLFYFFLLLLPSSSNLFSRK